MIKSYDRIICYYVDKNPEPKGIVFKFFLNPMSQITSSLNHHQTPLRVNHLQCLNLSWLGFSEEFTQVMGNCDWGIEPEVFITKAHWLVHKQMTVEVLRAIEEFCFAPNAPSALLFKNLPVDNLLPLTPKTSGVSAAKCPISEGLILGIGRCFGQPFTYPYLKERGGLIQDLVPMEAEKNLASTGGSLVELKMHRDFPFHPEATSPDLLFLLCLRGDSTQKAYTMLCDARTLCNALEPEDVELLRLHPIEWRFPNPDQFFQKPAITGTRENPCVNLTDENVAPGSTIGSPIEEVQSAYERLREKAAELATGVFLSYGDLLIISNKRTVHARTSFTPRFDGSDRWLKKIFISFNLWNNGNCQWPSREMPLG